MLIHESSDFDDSDYEVPALRPQENPIAKKMRRSLLESIMAKDSVIN